MKTLQLHNGDLVIGSTGYEMVTGASLVAQDLRCALGEPIGNDRFHPGYGSALSTFIGQPLDESTRFTVEQEVNRVVGNYSAIQQDKIQRDALTAARSRFSTADVVSSVTDVKVEAVYDSVKVSVEITTMAGQNLTVEAGVA